MRYDLSAIKQTLRERAAQFEVLVPNRSPSADDRAEALEILDGKFRFSGNHQTKTGLTLLDVGRQSIDWAGGHCHHQEWPTQMGRFFMLGPLMTVFRDNGDPRLAEAARGYIDDWIAHFDAEDITLRGNTCMDIGIRLGTHNCGGWTGALALFLDAPAWDDAFIGRMLASIERQAHILWKRGIPSRNWGNHRVFGLDGLLHVTLRLPFTQDAETMRDYARVNLERAARRQFLEDGVHVEQTLGYHNHVTNTFVYLHRLGQIFPEAAMDLPIDRLIPAADYSLHALGAGVNDTAAERFDRAQPSALANARAWRETLTGNPSADWLPARDAVYPCAGQVFCRSSWQSGADFLAVDMGPYSGSHAHLARLGLVFRSGGRLWLADPGTFDYEMTNPFSVYGRSTPTHCTLNLNGLNQGLGDARLLTTVVNDDVVFLRGVYAGGYWTGAYKWGFQNGLGRGTHGRHERMILWVRGEYLLVFDGMMGDPAETVESVWQLAPVETGAFDPGTLTWHTVGEAPGFHLQFALPPSRVSMSVYEGEKEPLRGWFCERSAVGFSPAPQVVFRYPCDSAFYAMLAMPLAGGKAPPVVRQSEEAWGRCLELHWEDGQVDLVGLSSSLAAPLAEDSPFETDSPLVWLRLDRDGHPVRQFILDGTFLRYRGATP